MASRGLEGFSPQIRRLLELAGVDLSGGAGRPGGGSWGRGLAPSAAEQAASPWYQLARATGKTPEGWLTDAGNPAVAAAKRSPKMLDPSVQKLLDQVERARSVEAGRGAEDTRPKPNLLMRGLDYLGRPGAAVMGALTETGRSALAADRVDGPESGAGKVLELLGGIGVKAGGKTPGDVARGAGRGFTAKERYHGSKLLDEAGVDNRAVRAVAGFGLDVAVDPLTYVTFGTAPIAAKGAARGAAAVTQRAAVRKGADDAVAAGARMPADELVRQLTRPGKQRPITDQAIEVAALDVGRQAAAQARSALADDLVKIGMPAAQAKAASARWLNPAARETPAQHAQRVSWFTRLSTNPATAKAAYLAKPPDQLVREAAETTRTQLTALADANMSAAARKAITVKAAGIRLASVPIPLAVQSAARAAASVPAAQKAIGAFDRTFNTGSRFDRHLTALKARSAGTAERRIEAARDDLVATFKGTSADQRVGLMQALAGAPGWGTGVLKLPDGRDGSDAMRDVFDHVGRYLDVTGGKGPELLTVADLNRFLPKRFKFDKTTLAAPAASPADAVLGLVERNAGHLATADPAQFAYALHIAVEKGIARDQLARGAATFGVPVASPAAAPLTAGGKMTGATAKTAAELRAKHGWSEIVTTGRDKDVGASYAKHFEGLIFDPETKRGLTRLLAVADDVSTRGEVLRLYDTALAGLKKLLTLPSPSYHLRNSFGDMFLGYLDDVSGPRGVRSYEQASRTMLALRSLGKQPGLRQTLDAAVDPATGVAADPIEALAAAMKAGGRAPGPGNRVMKAPRNWPDAPGGYLSAEQLWAAYNHTGLKRGFVSADLEQQLSTRAHRPIGTPMDKLMDLSQAREDYFRLAHMIDRLKRSKESTFAEAAEEAAHYVRKFHFDYHDVTPTEQALFARIMPFYKFQRFAAPLMVQMFFAKPGKIVNAQRGLYATSDAAGYERDDMGLPTADQVLPEYFRDAAMIPLYDSVRGNTVYANPGFPSTQLASQTLGLSADDPGGVAKGVAANIVGSVNPMVQAPFELATGRRIFGGGDVPVGPLPTYLASKTPITNQAFVKPGKEDQGTSFASFMTGLGLSENTTSRQRGALLDELKKIGERRKKDGFKPPKNPRSRSDSRSDTRGK